MLIHQGDPMGRVGIRPTLFKLMAGRDHPEFSGKSQQVREQSEKFDSSSTNELDL